MTICTHLRIREVRVYGLRGGTPGDGSDQGLRSCWFSGVDEAAR
jgi:hypothetical protein